MVFETAIRIERHLMAASQRIADMVMEALEAGITEEQVDTTPESDIG
jgi:hypothetical protein